MKYWMLGTIAGIALLTSIPRIARLIANLLIIMVCLMPVPSFSILGSFVGKSR